MMAFYAPGLRLLIARDAALVLLAVFAAGCASPRIDSDAGYPKSFPLLSTSPEPCPVFARGGYRNVGTSIDPADGSQSQALLSRQVLRVGGAFNEAEVIKILVASKPLVGGLAEIQALRLEANTGATWTVPKNMLGTCNSGWLLYPYESSVGGAPGLAVVQASAAELQIAVDGSLIARTGEKTSTIVLIVPVQHRSGTRYYRFTPADDTSGTR